MRLKMSLGVKRLLTDLTATSKNCKPSFKEAVR
jgi:hypothetical protein